MLVKWRKAIHKIDSITKSVKLVKRLMNSRVKKDKKRALEAFKSHRDEINAIVKGRVQDELEKQLMAYQERVNQMREENRESCERT